MDLTKQALHASAKQAANSGRSFALATSEADEAQVPSQHLFDNLETLTSTDIRSDKNELPSVAQCAVHLELLECIYALQHRVLNSNALDRTFGIKHDRTLQYSSVFRRQLFQRQARSEPVFQERRKRKWEYFVQAAAVRFETWWNTVLKSDVKLGLITDDSLPPLDVLMIWHALLLNPKMYRRRCSEVPHILAIPFPWTSIHNAIKSRDRTFGLNTVASGAFTQRTGFEADLFNLLHAEALANGISTSLELKGPALDNPELVRMTPSEDSEDITTLTSAFSRQADFTTKMAYHYIWLRSLFPHHTLSTGRIRYGQFLALFRAHPSTMLVPALDIDLVWHTHQLSPSAYYDATTSICGRMIDHDAGLSKGTLDTGWETTSRLWEADGLGEYGRCLCWECLAADCLVAADGNVEDYNTKLIQDTIEFYRAVEKARRTGGMLPAKRTW